MKFTDQQWLELSRLLDEALALPAAEREAWLDTLPPSSDALGPMLREILSREADGDTNAFLKTLPCLGYPLASAVQVRLREGAVIGPYRLLRQLGRGGMGSVWLAERTDGVLKRAVALKLPHAAAYGAQLAERFARERDILAALSHPRIARLYDAGVDADGQPYLALEYVDGEPLDKYCDGRRLELVRRLALFLQVLDAVQYAHARLVVHRDLKPSNILVENGEVHLLDFGIAKLVADKPVPESDLTQAVGPVLTPDYASPEQIAGVPLSTAADIYSLGVILYELCTGERPYRLKRDSRAALEEAILEAEIVRPSAVCKDTARAMLRGLSIRRLQKALRADLDTIILKALKKNPAERYSSVTAFADDVRRYLGHEPLRARPDSLGYRSAKFLRRNRLAATLSGIAVLALIAGLAGTITQAQRATRQALLAEQERNRADRQARTATEQRDFALRELSRAAAINDLNEFLLSDAAPSGKPFTAGELLSRAAAIVERQRSESDATRAEMLIAIGGQYSSMDHDDAARRLLGRAYDMSRGLEDRATRARASCTLAPPVGRAGDVERAEALLREGLADLPDEPQFTFDRMSCLLEGAQLARDASDAVRAIERSEAAQSLLRQLRYPSTILETRVLMSLAASYDQANDFPKAVPMFERAYAELNGLGRGNTATAGAVLNGWGLSLHLMGQTLKAEELFRKAIGISTADGSEKNVPPMRYTNLARTLLDLDRTAEGARDADLAYRLARAAGDERVVTQSLLMRARAYRELGDLERVEQVVNEIEPRARRKGADPILLSSLAYERAMLADARGDIATAQAAMEEAVANAERGPDEEAAAIFLLRRAEFDVDRKRFDRAREDTIKASRSFLKLSGGGAPSSYVGRCYLAQGRALQATGQVEEARRVLAAAAEQLRSTLGPDHSKTKLAERLQGGPSGRTGSAH